MTHTPHKMTLDAIRSRTTVNLQDAAAFLDMSAASAYRAADAGRIPTVQVGVRRRVPVALLLAMVGIPYESAPPEPAPV